MENMYTSPPKDTHGYWQVRVFDEEMNDGTRAIEGENISQV